MENIRWEDMVFANRNQSYGAYVLRKAHAGNVVNSFIYTMAAVAMLVVLPIIAVRFTKVVTGKTIVQHVITILPPPVIETIKIEPPKPPVQQTVVQTTRFVPPRVTEAPVEDTPPTIEEIRNVADQSIIGDAVVVDTPGPEPVIAEVADKTIYTWVEQQPEFPGGFEAMMKFIGKNVKYPSSARRMGVEGSVFISFIVNPDGTVNDVQTVKGISADCDQEAMKVVGKMPSWKPGKQNGKAVKVRLVLPIKFALGA